MGLGTMPWEVIAKAQNTPGEKQQGPDHGRRTQVETFGTVLRVWLGEGKRELQDHLEVPSWVTSWPVMVMHRG